MPEIPETGAQSRRGTVVCWATCLSRSHRKSSARASTATLSLAPTPEVAERAMVGKPTTLRPPLAFSILERR